MSRVLFQQVLRATSRISLKQWATIGVASSVAYQTGLAVCDAEQFPIRKAGSRVITQPKPKDEHSNVVAWGFHLASNPHSIEYFKDKNVRKMGFSSNLQCVLEENGSVYLQFKHYPWQILNDLKGVIDIALNDHSLYIVNGNGQLLEYIYDKDMFAQHHSALQQQSILQSQSQSDDDSDDISSVTTLPQFYATQLPKEMLSGSSDDMHRKSPKYTQIGSDETETNHFISTVDTDRFVNQLPESVIRIASTDGRVMAIGESGTVYVRGDNTHGACGIGNNKHRYLTQFEAIPSKFFDAPIIDFAAGLHHSLFVTETGRLFACGADNFMQLGLGWTKQKCVQAGAHWSDVGRAGYNQTAIAFNETDVDINDYFYEVPPHDEFVPRVVMGPYFDEYRVISVSAGDYHSAIITEPLDIINPLLRNRQRSMYRDPRLKRTTDTDANSDTSDAAIDHRLSMELRRRVITFGSSLKGQLGHCNFVNAREPRPLKQLETLKEFSDVYNDNLRLKACQVACGKEHTLVLMQGHTPESESMVFAFGGNQYNQVTKQRVSKIANPSWLETILPQYFPVHKIAAGNYQSAAFA